MTTRFDVGRASLGVIGGGQLGRMFVHAAQAMGFRAVVLDPDPNSPAGGVAEHHIRSDYLDHDGLAELAREADAITTEFENVPAQALAWLAEQRPVAPQAASVAVCQDRLAEKAALERCGVPCAPYAAIRRAADIAAAPPTLFPGILKTARLGYDGLGQIAVADAASLAPAWHQLGSVACVLEQRLPLAAELSVIVARNRADQIVHLPVQHNLHRGGILAVTQVPSPAVSPAVSPDQAGQAVAAAERIARAIDHIGVLCVEFFVLESGALVANEMAPRPHNSGHYTIDACDVSQFELQVRVMAGLPLTAPRQHSAAVMLNLLGDLWLPEGVPPRTPPWADVLALPGARLHLYGKREARRGRKMGHLTIVADAPDGARAVALQACERLGLPGF
jgi:5-(carboxyamino)imidazole ribonucleotide synthase